MARFTDIAYLQLGEYMRDLIKDPERIARIKSGELDIKQDLREFMTPRGVSWDDIDIVAHFDEARTVHIAFPFTGDVEESIAAFEAGETYKWPEHYSQNPDEAVTNLPTPEENRQATIERRKKLYFSRIGDYVMSRCR